MSHSREVTKNGKAWQKLFDKYDILRHIEKEGSFQITSTQINEFREARLMTKFDHTANLPELFSKNALIILPITRGSYIISHFEAYKPFEHPSTEILPASFPEYIESIDYENITSEAMAINCAYASGILDDFLNDETLIPTIDGRMSSDCFSFKIRNKLLNSNVEVDVVNSQIEIDGGYEGKNKLALIEAKNFISEDFIIRQLYYPYRLWSNKVTKQVIPIFLIYSNGIFRLYQYEFQDPNNYNSLVLVKHKKYSIVAKEITLKDIIDVLQKAQVIEEPKIPFPQANSFERVINLCELLSENELTRDEITQNYAFDPRQTSYYTDAGRYLNLINKRRENNEIYFSLTEKGKTIIRSKYIARQLKFAETILKHKVFNDTLRLCLKSGQQPSLSEIVIIMKRSNLYNIKKDDTFKRRASTVKGWINWILNLIDTCSS